MTTRASKAIDEALVSGGLADFQGGPGRLTVRALQRLAEGQPVPPEDLVAMIVGLDIGLDEARALLERRTERDGAGNIPVVHPQEVDTSSVAAIWSTFCHRSYFFPTRAEAEAWADGDDHVEPATLDEGLAVARQLADIFLGE